MLLSSNLTSPPVIGREAGHWALRVWNQRQCLPGKGVQTWDGWIFHVLSNWVRTLWGTVTAHGS